MLSRFRRVSGVLLSICLLVPAFTTSVFAAEGRQIEEVVVTAERRESSVQDTAISITAFTGEFIEDFGLRNQEDLQNYIPATTIQPYDLSIRGVGRLYRALGGDPGVATYFDGAYSEDFGIASTEGGLFDLERIEVLRGPQGTLYGRNGIGGAVNFISKRPSEEFEGEIKTIFGSYNTKEIFSMLSGPLIDGFLNARVVGVKRTRDGFMDELGNGTDTEGNRVSTGRNRDLNNYGDENYSLTLEFTPTDNLNILVRGNERSYRRNMSGAQGAGSLVVSEMGGLRDPVTGGERWSSTPMYGWRSVQDPNAAGATFCADAIDRSTPDCIVPTGLVPYINGTGDGQDANGVYTFNFNGLTRYAQPIVAGVDSVGDTNARNNYAYNANAGQIAKLNESTIGTGRELPELEGDDIKTWTNGYNDEFFDQQAAYMSVSWDVADNLTLKYIGGYTDYFYDRTTEDDRTGMQHDLQFYAAQENENYQHELQLFWDINENLNVTAGLFMYENDIDQQLDFYHTDSWTKYTDNNEATMYGALAPLYAAFFPGTDGAGGMVNHRSAQNMYRADPSLGAVVDDPLTAEDETFGGAMKASYQINSLWQGDNLGSTGKVDHGPVSDGTTFIWDTENRTSAKAVYFQGEWQINDTWALTLGGRWAEDKKEAEENLFVYAEAAVLGLCDAFGPDPALCGDGNGDGVTTLAEYNQNITGALDANGNVVNFDTLRTQGVPLAASIYREFEEDFDDITWRVNVDFSPTEDDLVYFSVTTGYRAGGFNLGFASPTPVYDKEDIIAYELGYKGQMLDGTLQVNASAYLYQYEGIALQFRENGGIFGPGTSVTNGPDVDTIGFEADVLWLATDNLTIGFNYSFTDTEYQSDSDRLIIDNSNPYAPVGVYSEAELEVSIDGEPVPRIPKNKATIWGEYTWSLGDNGKLVFLTSVGWTDEFAARGSPRPESPLTVAPDYSRWDFRATWSSANEQWGVSAFVNNILDEVGIRNMNVEDQNQNFKYTVEPTNPRMAGIELQYKFGAF
jgi:outer membrane receptor protein involved in Fe transport